MISAKNLIILLIVLAIFGCSSTAPPSSKLGQTVDEVLNKIHRCNDRIILRYQHLTVRQIQIACNSISHTQKRFHQVLATKGKPVADDYNQVMRANIYASRSEFVRHATNHFEMPTDNGGMYLEGNPSLKHNQAEFVAYVHDGNIWNLEHEFVHYLDSRYNLYGDFCLSLHDDHEGPEYCPKPTPSFPHLVWWSEGLAEYLAYGLRNPAAVSLRKQQAFFLSELFNTSYNRNNGPDRVYGFSYLAVRYMLENHQNRVGQMLVLTRHGDYVGYQALVRSWGRTMDQDFARWLKQL